MPDAGAPERRQRPLFRPEALAEPEFGEALDFEVPSWRAIGVVAIAATFLFLTFGLFAEFDRTAQAQGIIVPASGVARIAAPQYGTVSAVYVRQGQQVPRGARLFTVQSPNRLPDGQAASREVLAAYRREQQLVRAGGRADAARRAAERQRLAAQVAELNVEASSHRTQLTLQQERITKNEQRLAKLAPARARGYVSETTILAIEEALLTQRQQLAALRQQVVHADHELQRTQLRISELAAEERKAHFEAEATLLDLERGATGAQADGEVLVSAPTAGTVSALAAAEGMSVRAGEELGAIIRSDDAKLAELHVPSSAAGNLRSGLTVTLRYDAFPHLRYGVGHGVISDIARASTRGPDGAPGYRVRVRLLDAHRFKLLPDMRLAATITVERRSLIDWLFAPMREKWREARR